MKDGRLNYEMEYTAGSQQQSFDEYKESFSRAYTVMNRNKTSPTSIKIRPFSDRKLPLSRGNRHRWVRL